MAYLLRTCDRRLLLLVTLLAGAATAVAGPIAGDHVSVKRSATRQDFKFSTRSPFGPLPAPGSFDGGPGTFLVEVFSPAQLPPIPLRVPQQDAPSGWKATLRADGSVSRYTYKNDDAPNALGDLQTIVLRDNGTIKFHVRTSPLTLDGAQGQLALRITIGAQSPLCTLFRGASVTKDQAGTFVGRKAPATEIADCDDATLGWIVPCGVDPSGLACGGACPPGEQCVVQDPFTPSCHCVGPTQPCGDTAPVCNGTCPSGTSCVATSGGTTTTCGCLPPDGCGVQGAYPTCGGTCPAGQQCYGYHFQTGAFMTSFGCSCADADPCSCSGGIACPAGQICVGQAVPNICIAQCQ